MTDVAPILAVDDDPGIRRAIGRILDEEGFAFVIAANAAAALEELKKQRFSLLILDVDMPPGETGFELAQRIRVGETKNLNRTIPILFVTAHSDGESYEFSFDVAAHGYVTKPFNAKALAEKVHNLLSPH